MRQIVLGGAVAVLLCLASQPGFATPMTGSFFPLDRCDGPGLPPQELTHELGETAAFNPGGGALNERFAVLQRGNKGLALCGQANAPRILDWEVLIRNTSREIWQDLYFVTDENIPFDNFDGGMLNPRAMTATHAFKLDQAGMNTHGPLIFNSQLRWGHDGDNLFEPGETWRIWVQDFDAPGGRFPIFSSLDFGTLSPPLPPPGFGSTASILANHERTANPGEEFPFEPTKPIPEPATIVLVGLGAAGLFARRRNR